MRIRTWLLMSAVATTVATVGCAGRMAYNLPPAQQMMHPGPGVGGPGPGVIPVGNSMINPGMPPSNIGPGGQSGGQYPGQACQYCEDGSCPIDGGGACMGGAGGMGGGAATSQIAFTGGEGLQIQWDVNQPGMFDSSVLAVPGRQDFSQGAIYRLKLTNIPGRGGVSLYPTMEVAPVTPRTDAYLAHSPIPVQFTEEDFDQVVNGNYVTKVIYLPDPEFQELALAGVETLVSTRLDPGCDPIIEADRRGSILAIIRMGNKDLEGGRNGGGGEGCVIPANYDGAMLPEGAEYAPGEYAPGEYGVEGAPIEGEMMPGGGADCYQGGIEGGLAANGMPIGMPTGGMSPNMMPPHMVQPGGQWGMPITGTPIGIPGPPHIPLGIPAGLQNHTMTNRTRVVMPPPTSKMHISVKQRPGMNYPTPVNKVHVDETRRAPFRPFNSTVPGVVPSALHKLGAAAGQHGQGAGQCEVCP
jgi:hypothetical protein